MAPHETPTTYRESISGKVVEVGIGDASFQAGSPGRLVHADAAHSLFSGPAQVLSRPDSLPSLGLVLSQVRSFQETLYTTLQRPGGGGEGFGTTILEEVGHLAQLRDWTVRQDWFQKLPMEGTGKVTARIIQGLVENAISLEPAVDGPFQAWNLWTLEPLFLRQDIPFKRKLHWSDDYLTRLEQVLESIFFEYRTPTEAPEPEWTPPQKLLGRIEVAPRSRIEPVPTVYMRMAVLFRRMMSRLREVCGVPLDHVIVRFDVGTSGKEATLAQAIEDEIRLLAGLHLLCTGDLGTPPSPELEKALDPAHWEAAAKKATTWIENPLADPALPADPRTLLVLSQDPETGKYSCAGMAGLELSRLNIVFRRPPTLELADEAQHVSQGLQTPRHIKRSFVTVREVWLEAQLERPCSHAEWRALCDQHKSLERIRAALS